METKQGQFYIGRKSETEPLLYKADTLATHGVIVGMTGSGKTGLGVNVIEEALLSGIPTLVIDPKGDMGNIALTFPENTAADLEPWMDESKATRKGMSVADLAAATAAKRETRLLEHDLTPERVRRLHEETDVTIYTPGSTSGVGLNVLGSLKAPDIDWDVDAEIVRDEIEGFVSSLLVLADVDSDPVSGPEHILLSTIIETWWRNGKDLDLATLIGQIPDPPFRKLGVFDLDTFFDKKKRMALALKLNGLLASPSFASWLEGEPLDVERLIGASDKTKCAVIYLAHLSDQERQFMVTLLLSKLLTWIRSQPGSEGLRALVYMDEAFGYAPPTAEPPSKKPILTILKQARAFGVGLVLVTQNPVDLDYKAMSNAGTWIVGRLQTENDKKRILEGMQSLGDADGTIDLDAQISNLEKRQFILHTAKKGNQTLFTRRYPMCYRYGPLTRNQVADLMADKKLAAQTATARDGSAADPLPPTEPAGGTSAELAEVDDATVPIQPTVAEGIPVGYLDPAAPWIAQIGGDPLGSDLAAGVAATVRLRYDDTRAGVDHSEVYEAVIFPVDGMIDIEDVSTVDHDDRDFRDDAPAGAVYTIPDAKLQNKTFWTGLGSDLKNHLVSHQKVEIFRNPELKLYSRVDESEADFTRRWG
ncbi:MAG: ATP-binding protein, partial [Acidimicrobiia bacterium]